MEESGGKLCEREANFQEMYKVLGNKTAQEKIRQENPKAEHCSILMRNAHACMNQFGQPENERESWSVCPNNPYFFKPGLDKDGKLAPVERPEAWKDGKPVGESYELRDRREQQMALIAYAGELYEMYQFDKRPLSSLEYSIVAYMAQRERIEDMKLLSRMVGSEVRKLAIEIYGAKDA